MYFFLLCLFVSSFHVKPLSLKSDSETRTSYKFLGHFGPKGKLYILCFCCVTFTIFPDWLSSTSVGVLAGLQLHTFQAENVSSRTTCSQGQADMTYIYLYIIIYYIYAKQGNAATKARSVIKCLCHAHASNTISSNFLKGASVQYVQFNSCLGSAWPPLGERKTCASCCRARTNWW